MPIMSCYSMKFANELIQRCICAFQESMTQVPSVMAIFGNIKGFVEGFDYQGTPVFASIKSIPGTNWQLVAKISREETLAG